MRAKCLAVLSLLAMCGTASVVSGEAIEEKATCLFPITEAGRCGYIDRMGAVVVDPVFQDAQNMWEGMGRVNVKGVPDTFFGVNTVGGLSGYVDGRGKLAVPPRFVSAERFSDGLAAVAVTGSQDPFWVVATNATWGYIDKSGEFVIPPRFKHADTFQEGLAGVVLREDEDAIRGKWGSSKWGFVNKSGKMVIPPQFSGVHSFSEGLAAVNVGGEQNVFGIALDGKWGFIDTKGEFVIPAHFTGDVLEFAEGLAGIRMGGKKNTWGGTYGATWGYIDHNGVMAIQSRFDGARSFSEGLAAVKTGAIVDETYGSDTGGKWGFIDKKGDLVIAAQFDIAFDFSEGLAPVCVKSKWGYIDRAGQYVIAPTYSSAFSFKGGLGNVREQVNPTCTRFVLIDKSGRMLAQVRSEVIPEFSATPSEGLLAVTVGDKCGYVDRTGNLVIPPRFDGGASVGSFCFGMARVSTEGKSGYIDRTGRVVIPCDFDSCRDATPDAFLGVRKGDKWGFIDKLGKEVIPPQFDSVGEFSLDRAPVKIAGTYGFIDRTGRQVIGTRFAYVLPFSSNGLAAVREGDKYGFVDTEGNWVIKPQYDRALEFVDGIAPIRVGCTRDNRGALQGGKWGYIDKTGTIVVPPQYDPIENFKEGLAAVTRDGKVGYINTKGRLVVGHQFEEGREFSQGLAAVSVLRAKTGTGARYAPNKYWGFIDAQGRMVIEPHFVTVSDFCDDVAVCEVDVGRHVIVDRAGKWLTQPMRYSRVSDFGDGWAVGGVYCPEVVREAYVDRAGKCVWRASDFSTYIRAARGASAEKSHAQAEWWIASALGVADQTANDQSRVGMRAEALCVRGWMFMSQEKWLEAADTFRQNLGAYAGLSSSDQRYLGDTAYGLGISLWHQRQYEDAGVAFARCAASLGGNAVANAQGISSLAYEGRCRWRLGKKVQGSELLARAQALAEKAPKGTLPSSGYTELAWALFEAGEFDKASAAFAFASQVDPRARFGGGLTRFYAGDFRSALKDFALGFQFCGDNGLNNRDNALWGHLAACRAGVKDGDTLSVFLKDSVNPWDTALASMLLGRISPDNCLEAAQKGSATNVPGQECEGHFFVGQWYLLQGDKAKAKECFQKAIATGLENFLEYMAAKHELQRTKE